MFAPPNPVDGLLLKLFEPQTVKYVVWLFIQIGAVVTCVYCCAFYWINFESKYLAC